MTRMQMLGLVLVLWPVPVLITMALREFAHEFGWRLAIGAAAVVVGMFVGAFLIVGGDA